MNSPYCLTFFWIALLLYIITLAKEENLNNKNRVERKTKRE